MSHPDDGVLQELLDGELAPADEAVVRAHIAGCAPCTTALAELKTTQAEADTIVARLDLDPPLPVRQVSPVRRARPDLRMLGLAASAVIVAGTSWLLFRSPNAAQSPEKADTASGVVLPLPALERQEVAATTPAAPPAAAAPAEQKARPVAPSARGSGFAAKPQDRKDERGAAAPENDVANVALRSADAVAAQAAPSAPLTLADAEARFGGHLLTITGLTPQTVEIVPAERDSQPQVRQTYLVGGVPVILVQRGAAAQPTTLVARDEVTTKQAVAEKSLVEKEKAPAQGFVAGRAAAPAIQRRLWEADGFTLSLQGALPADSLEALARRVR